jgi:hypothetical protein
MKYTILEDGRLKLSVDEKEQSHLRYLREDENALLVEFTMDSKWGSRDVEEEVLESLICNSDLEWIPDGVCMGDLTSAPMLGITDTEVPTTAVNIRPNFGFVLAGGWPDSKGVYQTWHRPVIQRWAWMDYAVRSFLDELADCGECVWEGGAAQ